MPVVCSSAVYHCCESTQPSHNSSKDHLSISVPPKNIIFIRIFQPISKLSSNSGKRRIPPPNRRNIEHTSLFGFASVAAAAAAAGESFFRIFIFIAAVLHSGRNLQKKNFSVHLCRMDLRSDAIWGFAWRQVGLEMIFLPTDDVISRSCPQRWLLLDTLFNTSIQ